jgi:dipeptidase E
VPSLFHVIIFGDMRILALSSSRSGNSNYMEAALPMIRQFLGEQPLDIAFLPFAAVDSYDEYYHKVHSAFSSFPYKIHLVNTASPLEIIESANVIMIGGGNTFKLLHDLYDLQLVELIKKKVAAGIPYIGWSAGANLTGLTISTTNDMPIIQPQSFTSFGWLPLQLNPHYINETREGFHGETRDQRIGEFLKLNPDVPVVGLAEGTALQLEGDKLAYLGNGSSVLFRNENGAIQKTAIEVDTDLSFLLH